MYVLCVEISTLLPDILLKEHFMKRNSWSWVLILTGAVGCTGNSPSDTQCESGEVVAGGACTKLCLNSNDCES